MPTGRLTPEEALQRLVESARWARRVAFQAARDLEARSDVGEDLRPWLRGQLVGIAQAMAPPNPRLRDVLPPGEPEGWEHLGGWEP